VVSVVSTDRTLTGWPAANALTSRVRLHIRIRLHIRTGNGDL
jgi:hypothetical protein